MRQESLNIAGAAIGIGLVGIMGFLSWALVYVTVPADNETAMNVLLGILSSQVSMVVGFYYGSSSTNKRQSDTIDKLAETAKTVTQAAMPTPPAVTLQPGESATVEAAEPRP